MSGGGEVVGKPRCQRSWMTRGIQRVRRQCSKPKGHRPPCRCDDDIASVTVLMPREENDDANPTG